MPFEDWEADHKLSKRTLIVIALVAILALAGTAVAVYKIVSPPSDPVVVATPATLSKPTVNATSAVEGDTIHITTTLSDAFQGLQVFFYENNVQIGSDYTNDQGLASYDRVINNAGTFVYTAECMHP